MHIPKAPLKKGVNSGLFEETAKQNQQKIQIKLFQKNDCKIE